MFNSVVKGKSSRLSVISNFIGYTYRHVLQMESNRDVHSRRYDAMSLIPKPLRDRLSNGSNWIAMFDVSGYISRPLTETLEA